MNEKSEKFKFLATKRVNNTLNQIRLIGNLSNKTYYEYTTEDAKKIISSLEREIKTVKERFLKKQNKESEFKL